MWGSIKSLMEANELDIAASSVLLPSVKETTAWTWAGTVCYLCSLFSHPYLTSKGRNMTPPLWK